MNNSGCLFCRFVVLSGRLLVLLLPVSFMLAGGIFNKKIQEVNRVDKMDKEIKEVKELQEEFDRRQELQEKVDRLICAGEISEASKLLREAEKQKEG